MNTKLLTKIIFVFFLFFCSSQGLATASVTSDDAKAFIEDMGQKAIAILADSQKTRAKRESAFREILQDFFALQSIGKFVLGRYWSQLHQKGQAAVTEYFHLFESEIVRAYAIRFEDYQGEKFLVTNAQQEGDKWVVSSTIERPEGQAVSVNWLLAKTSHGLRVVDVVVEGVSMSVTKRSEYAAIISQNGGIEGFLKILQRQYKN